MVPCRAGLERKLVKPFIASPKQAIEASHHPMLMPSKVKCWTSYELVALRAAACEPSNTSTLATVFKSKDFPALSCKGCMLSSGLELLMLVGLGILHSVV